MLTPNPHPRLRADALGLVARIVRTKRRAHRELRAPVTLAGLRAIAKREGVRIRHFPEPSAPAAADADVLGLAATVFGAHTILLHRGLRGEVRRRVLAHELAHVWLGHCAEAHAPAAERTPLPEAEAAADHLAAAVLRVGADEFRAPIAALSAARASRSRGTRTHG